MDYEEFKDYLVSNIKNYLPDSYVDSEVSISKIAKNNQSLDAIMIKNKSSNISPTIYLDKFYYQYSNGVSIDDVLASIAKIQMEYAKDESIDLKEIVNFDAVKDRISCKILGVDNNEELLKSRPHTIVGNDLAVVYHVCLEDSHCAALGGGIMTVPITYPLMDQYGVNVENLHCQALKNMPLLTKAEFVDMNQLMKDELLADLLYQCDGDREAAEEMLATLIPPNKSMYVLSNKEKLNGATCILDTFTMNNISNEVGDFYILPSSIHEVIIVPKSTDCDLSELEQMVNEVNSTEVAPEDRLSDHVYAYDPEVKEIYRADLEEEHRAKVNEMKQNNSRTSLGR